MPGDVIILHMCIKNMIRSTVPEIWCTTDGQMDRQTDGQADGRMDGWMDKQKDGKSDS